ncbi:Crp/Fnr family transcriptional regulator [Sutterella wadsworthensis]|uniref:Crp/Fnr family transcriptional regulator n=1 Tax=Sutterella wadsworthensis TaxID=40545 RepID=UPI00307D73A0
MNKPRMPKELIPLLEPGILYSKCPWRFHPDPPLLEKLFVDAPVVELPAHIDHAFGRESFVYWIDQGILATCAPRTRGPRMTALFVPRTILGGPKALLHKRPLELTIRTLSPVRLRRRDALQFRRFLADHPGIELEYLRTLAWNHEAQLDGLLVNGLDPVPVRLARLFLSLLAIGGEESSAGLLSDWIKRGLIERNGRKIIVLPNFKAAFESSLAL